MMPVRSPCGSAGFDLGRSAGEHAREQVIRDLACWQRGILVIDGKASQRPEIVAP
jgi:hypothetical protein